MCCDLFGAASIANIMFLKWIATQGLLQMEEGADPLAVFDPEARSLVSKHLLADIDDNPARLAAASTTEPQLAFLLSCLGHALTLPFDKEDTSSAEIMTKALIV